MILGTIIQQPGENLDYDVDYSRFFDLENAYRVNILATNDAIKSATHTVEPVGLVVVPAINTDTVLKLWISGAAADTTYKVTITVVTNTNRVKIDEIIVIGEDY
jgi:hypothetical protein